MKKRKGIKLLTVATTIAAMLGVVGCGNEASKEEVSSEVVTSLTEPVKIEFWHAMSGAFNDTINEITEDFNNGIGADLGIEVKSVFQGSYDDLKSKTVAAIKAGTYPSVIQGTSNVIMELIQSDLVQPLNDFIFDEEVGIKDYEDIYEVYREEGTSFTDTETIYSLPFSKSTDLYFYNETFFNEHGLEVPTTWDELVETSKKIQEITGKPGFGIDNLANYFITQLFQSQKAYTNQNGEILFNHETSEKILTELREHITGGYWRTAGSDFYNSSAFLGGHVMSYMGSSAGAGYLHDENFSWNTAPLPQVDLANPAYIQQGNIVSVLQRGAEENYAAYEFIKYLNSHDVNLKWVTSTGYLPIRESVATSPEYLAWLKETGDCVKENGAISIQNAFSEALFITDSINSNTVRTEVGVMIEEIILTDVDVKETLNRYEEKLNY